MWQVNSGAAQVSENQHQKVPSSPVAIQETSSDLLQQSEKSLENNVPEAQQLIMPAVDKIVGGVPLPHKTPTRSSVEKGILPGHVIPY
jgi:hypothetical protein